MADEAMVDEAVTAYRKCASIPRISSGRISVRTDKPVVSVTSLWSQTWLQCNEKRRFSRKFYITKDNNGPAGHFEDDFPRQVVNEQLYCESPSGKLQAVLRKIPADKKTEENQHIEIWCKGHCINSYDLNVLDKHGKVYDDNQFGSFCWSPCERYLLYVAEKRFPKPSSFFENKKNGKPEEQLGKGKQFEYKENWGELLSSRHHPVLAIVDTHNEEIKVLEGIPETISPGQAIWGPDSSGVIFTGWFHEPYRLGLIHCQNRKSGIYYLSLDETSCEMISDGTDSVHSPRLSPKGNKLIYVARILGGPHKCCEKIMLYDWKSKKSSTLVDVVDKPENKHSFQGHSAPGTAEHVWSGDESKIVLDTIWRTSKQIILIDAQSGQVHRVTAGGGNWSLLDVQQDFILASHCTPASPDQLMIASLPNQVTGELKWTKLADTGRSLEKEIVWEVIVFTPENTQPGTWQDYEGLLMKPKVGQKFPLIVWPHGGPHSSYVADFLSFPLTFCQLGYAVLLVNFRGSLGFGQSSLLTLPGKIGNQDVRDVQFAAETVLKREDLDEENVIVTGGSHGGFLTAHLTGQYPNFYKACAVRNPVINVASMASSSDIPDWCYYEGGEEFSFKTLPTSEVYEKLLDKSPIKFADQVQTPTLLLLGGGDLRVPSNQGKQYYKTLKSHGVKVSMLWYPEDSHPLSRVETEADNFINMVTWFGTHLKR